MPHCMIRDFVTVRLVRFSKISVEVKCLLISVSTLMFCVPLYASAQHRNSSIRSIGFANFKYPGSRGLFTTSEYKTNSFVLQNGRSIQTSKQYGMSLVEVSFGDITGDGVEEAMVVLNVETDGSAGVDHVYLYRFQGGKPVFLWGFESGDRAWGGLKQVYANGGNLIIELYGKGTQIGGALGVTEPVGLCCPRSFTRTRYKWQCNRFRQQGQPEILLVPGQRDSR